MKQGFVRNSIAVISIVCWLQFSCGSEVPGDKVPVSNILADEYESVIVADGELLSAQGSFGRAPKQTVLELQMAFAHLLGAIEQNPSTAAKNLLRAGVVKFVAVGAKDFRPPVGLGGVLSDACYVLKLAGRDAVDFQRQTAGAPISDGTGPPVWRWTVRSEGRPTPGVLYVSQPLADCVVVASDRRELQNVQTRLTAALAGHGGAGSPLSELPDMREIRRSPIWGCRIYRRDSSVSNRQASGALGISPSGRALLFFANPAVNLMSIRYLSRDAVDDTIVRLSSAGGLPTFRPVGTGAWQATIPLNSAAGSQEQLFILMGMFGFGIYL